MTYHARAPNHGAREFCNKKVHSTLKREWCEYRCMYETYIYLKWWNPINIFNLEKVFLQTTLERNLVVGCKFWEKPFKFFLYLFIWCKFWKSNCWIACSLCSKHTYQISFKSNFIYYLINKLIFYAKFYITKTWNLNIWLIT